MTIFFNFFRRLRELSIRFTRSDVLPIIWLTALLIAIGMIAYANIEGWSWLDAAYFTIITITTVGYGDLSPQSPAGRLFAIFFTVFAIGIGGYAISSLAAYTIEGRAHKHAAKLRKRRMKRIEKLKEHYILCGADLLGTRVAEEFYLSDAPFVIIDPDEKKLKSTLLHSHPEYIKRKFAGFSNFDVDDLSEFEDRTVAELSEMLEVAYLQEDPTDDAVLVRAGIDRAKGIVAAMPDDRDNLSIVVGARALGRRGGNDKLRIMARGDEERNVRKMYLSGADSVRMPSMASGLEMAMHIMHPELGNWWHGLMRPDRDGGSSAIRQISLGDMPAWVGKTITAIHQSENLLVLAVKRNDKFVSPPPHDTILEESDIAILIG